MNLDWVSIENSWDQNEKSPNNTPICTGKKLLDQRVPEEQEHNLVYNRELGLYGFIKEPINKNDS